MEEDKTIYTIEDEQGERSTISIDKWAADILQSDLQDTHAWIQEKYELACSKFPHLTRRKKGDLVRSLAYAKANENEEHQQYIRSLF